jgi:hypothetical protein
LSGKLASIQYMDDEPCFRYTAAATRAANIARAIFTKNVEEPGMANVHPMCMGKRLE